MVSARGTVGIIGAGKLGTALATRALRAGLEVLVVGSPRTPDTQLLLDFVAPGARAASLADLRAHATAVVVAVPFYRARDLPLNQLGTAILIDATNYWAPTDGSLDIDLSKGTTTTLASWHHAGRWVKSLNHLGYHDIELDEDIEGQRVAVGVASDDDDAKAVVTQLVNALSFDPVDVGALRDGVLLEAGGRIFGRRLSAEVFQRTLYDARAA